MANVTSPGGLSRELFFSVPASVEQWLAAAAGSRDLTLPLAGDDPRAAAVRYLAATIAAEFTRYGEIVGAARGAVRENAAALSAVVASAEEQRRTVRAGTDDIGRAGDGALRVAEAAGALQRLASEAAGTRSQAEAKLEETAVLLGGLEGTLADAHRPTEHMAASVATVRDFVATLERIARHAKLLSVNATIEAAHLGTISRFGIVAGEIRRLSESTQAASARIRGVAGEWHESTKRVEAALAAGTASTASVRREIADATTVLCDVNEAFRAFSESVATIAVVSAEQQAAFDSVAAAVGEIAERAEGATRAASAASALDLDVYLENAERTLARWRYDVDPSEAPPLDDLLSRGIEALAGGDPADDSLLAPADEAILQAARALVAVANEDQRAILTDVGQASITVAQNLVAWRMIASAFAEVRSQIDAAGRAVEEATTGARTAVSMSDAMRSTFAAIGKQLDGAAESLASALAKIDEIGEDVIRTESLAAAMSEAAGRARAALAFIVDLSGATDLLSLNAAIEASRAGSRGRTFAVVAAEVRRLASTTHEATAAVSTIVSDVAAIGENVAHATKATRDQTDATSAGANTVHDAVEAMQTSFASTMQHATDVAAIAGTQAALLEGVLAKLRAGAEASSKTTSETANRGRYELFQLYSRAHTVAAARSVATGTAQLRALNERIAQRFEATFEDAIASGRLSPGALNDFDYTEITGPAISRLGRLFDVSRVPASGFAPPKFTNGWDAVVDEALCSILEDAFNDADTPRKIMLAFTDLNGFVVANPRSKINAWTGDPAKDTTGNRVKRFVEDDFTLESIRFGMGGNLAEIGRRARYDDFRRAGCALERPAGVRPWSVVVAARDIGDVFSDILAAVYVREQRLGTIRLARDPQVL